MRSCLFLPKFTAEAQHEWTNDNISISNNELAASGSTSMISGFTATNSSLSAQTATIEVTPTFTFGGNSNVGAYRIYNYG